MPVITCLEDLNGGFMTRIDAHVHYVGEHPEAIAVLEDLDLKAHNVCVASTRDGSWRERRGRYLALARAHPKRYTWCTTFDPPRFDDPDYVDQVIANLEKDFADGAVACKVWKNIGMEEKDPSGRVFMVDDPLWTAIFEWLEREGRAVIMHLADPIRLWEPPKDPKNARVSKWRMYDKPDFPSHEEIMAARDRVIARHPRLHVIGAHMGSQSHDLTAISERLDRFDNYAIDTSARLSRIARQGSTRVREFFMRYADRILWGTDIVKTVGTDMPDHERIPLLLRVREIYRHAFLYYESTDEVPVHERDFRTRGLGLPVDVLDRLYSGNAKRWIPGL